MKKLILSLFLLFGIILGSVGQTVIGKGVLTVKLIGFRNDKGQTCVSLFNNAKGFPGKYDMAYRILRCPIKENQAVLTFADLPYGTYALSVLHDENSNNKMDTSFIGIPKEGFGASNNPKGRLGPQTFDDAKFELKSNTKIVEINIKYF
jgi:uncharacterized protein (DUF2141 family)